MENIPSNWFMEFVTPDTIQQFAVKDVLYHGKSEFQKVEMIETSAFGKCLILDGKIQSCEVDEFIYHEALVQPVMTLHPNPQTVFIAGGGEGATLREVLSHKTVKKVVMVDIDREVIELCKMLGHGQIDQSAAQAAAWHLTDDLSWQQLANKEGARHLNGTVEPYFTADVLQRAVRIAAVAMERGRENPLPSPGEQPSPGETVQN